MEITTADFLKSSSKLDQLPPPAIPEYAFTGRSNVGKSSLINFLCNRKKLALTSSTPGKTQLINHYHINQSWYLVDLPGYGYARVSKKQRVTFYEMIEQYLLNRPNLMNVFVLVDGNIPPQEIDLRFMEFLGVNGLPFSIVFTKIDKPKRSQFESFQQTYREALLETWEELPPIFLTTSTKKQGKEDILSYIESCNTHFESPSR